MATRICKVKGFKGFIGGKDNDSIFDEGVIYDVKKICGEIILTPIGKQPKYNSNGVDMEMENLSCIIGHGEYLITEKERGND